MAFDSLGRYTASHKTWDHVGNMVPQVEHSEGQRPHGEFRPASWLPVQFYDKFFEDWFVIMPGKPLACDNDGYLVPAGLGVSGATVVYTANDVEAGVIDVRTGSPLLTAAIGTVTLSTIDGVSVHFMGRSGIALSVSKAVGVAPYAFWQWAGDVSDYDDGFNPAGLRRHNYNLQHQVAILCDYVLEVPLVPATTASANLTQASFANNISTFTALSNLPVAANTVRTPLTFADGTLSDADERFVIQKNAVADISAKGDWHIDLTTGVISTFADNSLGAGNIYTLTYSHYASAPTGSNVSRFCSALGDLKAGDFVKANVDSNFVKATAKTYGDGVTDNFDTMADILGQVLEVENVKGKDALDLVRTAYPSLSTSATGALPAYAGQMDQMPGSATGGVSDKVHYAGAADLVVRINLISR